MPDKSAWLVKKAAANTVELTNSDHPLTKYVYERTDKDLKIEAFENDDLVEELHFTRTTDGYVIETDSEGVSFKVALLPGKDTLTSLITLNGEQIKIETSYPEHPARVAEELKKHAIPATPRLKLLVDDIKRENGPLDEISRDLRLVPAVDVPHELLCIAACDLCGMHFLQYCIMCAECLRPLFPSLPEPA